MNTTDPNLEVRGVRASSVIVQRIPPGSSPAFMEWQRGISGEAAKFPGYLTTEVYPPQAPRDEWVVIVHFAHQAELQSWLDSPQRALWIANLPCKTRDFRITVLPTGFGDWFAGLNGKTAVPTWKAALSVLLGLYPTVMALHFFLAPHTQRFAPAFGILIGNAVGVAFLQWVGMPMLGKAVRPWVSASSRRLSWLGAAAIVAALLLMASLFRLAE